MRVLVTGAFGSIGGRFAEKLTELGHVVVLSSRRVPDALTRWSSSFEVRLADLQTVDSFSALLRGVDAVVHLASLDEHESCERPLDALYVSGEVTKRLLDAAVRAGAQRFIFFSTFYVYGSSFPETISEETPISVEHPYAAAHEKGEAYCRSVNRRLGRAFASSLRLSNVYGAPIHPSVARHTAHNDFCLTARREGRIVLHSSGTQLRDFVCIDDVARAADILLRSASPEPTYNLGGENPLRILDLAERVQRVVERLLCRPVPLQIGPSSAVPASTTRLRYSTDRLRTLGYRPTDTLDLETERFVRLLEHHA